MSRSSQVLERIVLMPKQYVQQNEIVQFVTAVENRKNFKKCPDKIFRHLASELGELDAAIYEIDKLGAPEDGQQLLHLKDLRAHLSKKVGAELIDMIFLCCYMADFYAVDLNEIIPKRMNDIAVQYGVERVNGRC